MSGENRARLFTGPGRPALKTVPAQNYIKIDGRGDPNGADFSNRVGALYALAYAVKAAYKAASLQQEIDDFTVCPLEGVWAQISGDDLEKDKLEYTLMIRQPDFISGELVRQAQEQVQRKKPNPLLGEITFGAMQDGLCVEILHIGSYDDEPASLQRWPSSRRRTACGEREIITARST